MSHKTQQTFFLCSSVKLPVQTETKRLKKSEILKKVNPVVSVVLGGLNERGFLI